MTAGTIQKQLTQMSVMKGAWHLSGLFFKE